MDASLTLEKAKTMIRQKEAVQQRRELQGNMKASSVDSTRQSSQLDVQTRGNYNLTREELVVPTSLTNHASLAWSPEDPPTQAMPSPPRRIMT